MTLLAVIACVAAASAPAPSVTWRGLGAGVEYAAISVNGKPDVGDGVLHVVRVDPTRARLRPLTVSRIGGDLRTARQWSQEFKLTAVINAGMYEQDFSTHTGFYRLDKHVNSAAWVKNYQAVLVIGPRRPDLPAATILDAAPGDGASAYEHYETVNQNLRLIRGPGVNVWKQNDKRWSEAAVALDGQGRVLFLFTRSPLSMHDFNDSLLNLPLGVVRAMHVEGGPEASLSVHGNGVDLDLSGSFETGFNENDGNKKQWPLPNVLGVESAP